MNVFIKNFVFFLLAVFCIYLGDHLLDSLKINIDLLSGRRLFYAKNRKVLSLILLISATTGGIFALKFLPVSILSNAFFLSMGCLFYLAYSYVFKTKPIPKEFLVALFYVLGTMFYTFSISRFLFDTASGIFLIVLFVIALENLLIYSIVDHDEDKRLNFISISTTYGLKFCQMLCVCAFITNFALLFWLLKINHEKWVYFLMLMVIHASQIFVYIQRRHLTRYPFYRWIGDGVFMLPFALLFID